MSRAWILGVLMVLAGCAPPPPANPMERHARLAMAAEFVARNCGGFIGGYTGAQQMRTDADRHAVTARALGATEQTFGAARQVVQTTFHTGAAMTSHQMACNQLVSELAWQAAG